MPLTAAIYLLYGSRAQDNARPIGVFYPTNVRPNTWEHLGGIWYRAREEEKVLNRRVNAEIVQAFAQSIRTGVDLTLRNGTVITWEQIPSVDESKLPPALLNE